jgi:hypothetical protein
MSVKQCEHCGKPVVIPDSISKEDVTAIIKEALGGQLGDFCSRFPALCGQVNSLEKKVNAIQEATTSHPTPTEALLEIWRNCPDCKPKAEKLGLIKPVEEKEEESSFPWIAQEA